MFKRYMKVGAVAGVLVALFIGVMIGCGQQPSSQEESAADVGAASFTSGASIQTSGTRAAGLSASGLSSISGKVTDCFTGDPISGANIFTNTSIATTDASGNYTLNNVPTGNITVAAIADGYNAMSAVSSASTINFGLFKRYINTTDASYPTATITGEVLDASGNRMTFGSTQEGNKNIYRYGSIYGSSSTYFAFVYTSVDSNGTYSLTAPAGNLFLSLQLYESIYDNDSGESSWEPKPGNFKRITLSEGETKTVNLQLPSAYATIEGTISSPTGYSYDNVYAVAFIQENNMGASISYNQGSADGSYNLQVPPSGDEKFAMQAYAGATSESDYIFAGGGSLAYNITIAGGETLNKNYTLLSPPLLSTPANDAVDVTVSGPSFSWTKPSGWDPDFYAFFINENYGSSNSFSLVALVPKEETGFQLPSSLSLTPEKTYYWVAAAVKSPGADVNSFDIKTISIEDASFMVRGFTTGKAANVLARIHVTPESVAVSTGEVQQFYATGYDSYDNPVAISPEWQTSSSQYGYSSWWLPGGIDSNGLLTATSEVGWTRTGYVLAQDGYVTGYATVEVSQ